LPVTAEMRGHVTGIVQTFRRRDHFRSHKRRSSEIAGHHAVDYSSVKKSLRRCSGMEIVIPNEFKTFVSHGVASGQFRSEDDAVREGLSLLGDCEQKPDARRTDLQRGNEPAGCWPERLADQGRHQSTRTGMAAVSPGQSLMPQVHRSEQATEFAVSLSVSLSVWTQFHIAPRQTDSKSSECCTVCATWIVSSDSTDARSRRRHSGIATSKSTAVEFEQMIILKN